MIHCVMFLIRKEVVTSAIPSAPLGMSHLCLHGEKNFFQNNPYVNAANKKLEEEIQTLSMWHFLSLFSIAFFLNINNFCHR